jgi:hypothetical protein
MRLIQAAAATATAAAAVVGGGPCSAKHDEREGALLAGLQRLVLQEHLRTAAPIHLFFICQRCA